MGREAPRHCEALFRAYKMEIRGSFKGIHRIIDGFFGIMAKKIEATIYVLGFIGFRV